MKGLYDALFIPKEKPQEGKFKLGYCSFTTDQKVDPFEFIAQNNFFRHVELENLQFLFSNTEVVHFKDEDRQMCTKDNVYENIYFNVCVYDVYNWCCHQAAPYFSVRKPDWDYMFGFARQRLHSGKVYTFLHSFNSKGEKFVDSTYQSKYEQQRGWVNEGTWKNTQFEFDDFHGYMGIKFPIEFVNKIVFGEKDGAGNIWGYLIKEVLNSRENTEKFIEILNKS